MMQNMRNDCLKKRKLKVAEGSKGVQQQKKKKQKSSKKTDGTTGTNESTSRSNNKRKQRVAVTLARLLRLHKRMTMKMRKRW